MLSLTEFILENSNIDEFTSEDIRLLSDTFRISIFDPDDNVENNKKITIVLQDTRGIYYKVIFYKRDGNYIMKYQIGNNLGQEDHYRKSEVFDKNAVNKSMKSCLETFEKFCKRRKIDNTWKK